MTVQTVRVGIGLLALSTLGCLQTAAPPPPKRPSATAGEQLVVGPGAFARGGLELRAWLAYGAIKVAAFTQHPPSAANGSGDDFPLELAGRSALAQFWAAKRAQATRGNADFDRQVEIWKAGFLPEYVVAIQARPGWTIPGDTVATLRLQKFAVQFTGDYAPGAPVAIQTASGRRIPLVPGDDFPDPASLPVGPQSCGGGVDRWAAVWAKWEQVVPTLGGEPVAASSPQYFGRQLIALQRDPTRARRAVTWVSVKVGHLALVEGFCAVEARDWPRAVAALSRAIALDPSGASPRFERSGALTMLKRYEEALRDVDAVLAGQHNDCLTAAAWRREGYVLVEMRRFDDARAAYEKSLELDPGNQIALDELQTIANALKRPAAGRAPVDMSRPPRDPVVITSCRPNEKRN